MSFNGFPARSGSVMQDNDEANSQRDRNAAQAADPFAALQAGFQAANAGLQQAAAAAAMNQQQAANPLGLQPPVNPAAPFAGPMGIPPMMNNGLPGAVPPMQAGMPNGMPGAMPGAAQPMLNAPNAFGINAMPPANPAGFNISAEQWNQLLRGLSQIHNIAADTNQNSFAHTATPRALMSR
ncbi:hypothetical protein GPECTOR_342g80 [Gonium pectorale]|uniref:Uncharacterized protein n=1 Tax=Gonium pectorale TaxID=33097 RepID=A0A150FVM2_GONPE|nr:hypothetical protein GPECTOR_342g80 [Gonium pectorale]|eukprot:KXZ41649.1 hypothetical protein GPECTOR_342g80 [Gonium pectorale]